MSMIHTLNWYRRHHVRHPDLELWPEVAGLTRDDIVLAGESMSQLARKAGTPCTRVAEAARGSWSSVLGERYCAVVVTAVETVVPASPGADREVWVDAELDGCEPLADSIRMIGRRSSHPDIPFVVRPSRRYGDLRSVLPGDVVPGDLLAFVVVRPVALHDIRRRSQHRERLY